MKTAIGRCFQERKLQPWRSRTSAKNASVKTAVKPRDEIKLGSALAAFGNSGAVSNDHPRRDVFSEPMRLWTDPHVEHWLDRTAADMLFVTRTSFTELYVGIELLPIGRRKDVMSAPLNTLLLELFDDRMLSFTAKAARAYSTIVAVLRV